MAPYILSLGRTSTFRMTNLEHSGNMSALTIRTTRMPSVHSCLPSCELVQLHTDGIYVVLLKRRCDEREGTASQAKRRRGAPSERLHVVSWNPGANKRTLGAKASHMASHRGFAGRKRVPTFRSRSCCNVSISQDTLSCRGPLAPRRTRRRTGQWKEKSPLPDTGDQRPDHEKSDLCVPLDAA